MEQIKKLFETLRQHLTGGALKDAVVSKPLSAGERHVLVLSEVTVAFGGGGGTGESAVGGKTAKGDGGGSGGASRASPVAVLVVEGGKVRLEKIGN
ncbi:MAG: spore germination protein GerW family protein [Myxococcales bacterium]